VQLVLGRLPGHASDLRVIQSSAQRAAELARDLLALGGKARAPRGPEDRGPIFAIDVPLASGDSLDASPDEETGAATVLLVDEDPDVRRLLSEVLRRRDFTVVEAPSLEAAAAVVERGVSVHLVLMNPVRTAADVTGLDRVCSTCPGARLLVMSGHPAGAPLPRAADARPGAAVLAKPFTVQSLLTKIRD